MIGGVIALLFAGNEATLDVSDHTEARVRVTQTVPGLALPQPSPAMDILSTPRLYYELASPKTETWRDLPPGVGTSLHRWTYSLTYTPSFLVQDVTNPDRTVLVINSGVVAADWRGHRTHLLVKEEGSYGSQSTAYLGLTAPTAGAPPQQPALVPGASTITSGSSRTTAIADYRLSPRWVGSALAEYLVTGGIGTTSQAVVPLQAGPRAELSANYAASRRDYLVTTASYQNVAVESSPCAYLIAAGQQVPSCAPDASIILSREVWRHTLTRRSYAELGAGFSIIDANANPDASYSGPASGTVLSAYPSALAAYSYGSPAVVKYPGYGGVGQSLRAEAALEPFVDYRGVADNHLGAAITYGYVNHRFAFTQQVAAGDSTGTVYVPQAKTFTTRTAIVLTLSRHVAVDGSVVYAWVDQAPYGTISSGYASLGLTVGTGIVRY